MQDRNKDDHLGGVVKSARQSMQLTQSQLAERLYITVRYLKSIENSGQKPSYDLLVRIVRELDITADTVFYPKGDECPYKGNTLQGDTKPS